MNKHELTASVAAKSRVRDRIFDTACDMFYKLGIRCVGVDAIASEAGTNKMSFYRSFASKDELVAEYLRAQEQEHWQWWDAAIAPYAGDARRQIEALFDAYVTKCRKKGVHGCAFINAAVELREPDHPALDVVHKSKAETRRRFRKLAKEAGASAPDLLGDALTLLTEGGAMSRLSFACQDGPGSSIPKIVRKLLDAYID
ncbi:MAG TPA: TetR/AcrR family transcriptional regulator [Spongiibacteraceae bacterium]